MIFSGCFFFIKNFNCCFTIFQLDRFIPNRSAMDFGYAHYMLTEGRRQTENPADTSPSKEAYRKLMAETLNVNRTRILAFKNKPPTPAELLPPDFFSSTSVSSSSVQQPKAAKSRRHIPQVGIDFFFHSNSACKPSMIGDLGFFRLSMNVMPIGVHICIRVVREHWMPLSWWMTII